MKKPYPFWPHGYAARKQRELELQHEKDVVISKAALAGWHWVYMAGEEAGEPCYHVVDPQGKGHGTNQTIYGAACYALAEMQRREASAQMSIYLDAQWSTGRRA